ncbi:MAG: Hpt domain-containing protein [Maritimibacter sp.]|nr:Hpt domain-containing protein [Maritimibacter sp.]
MIDWNRVSELKDEIGEEDFAEVAEMFIAEVEEVIDRLKAAPVPAHYEEDLHFIKSSALNLGFSELSALCQHGERQAAAGDADTIDLTPVFASYAASKAAFLAG